MFLGRELRKSGLAGRFFHLLDHGGMQRKAREILTSFGLSMTGAMAPPRKMAAA
jgi:hypothetical protein